MANRSLKNPEDVFNHQRVNANSLFTWIIFFVWMPFGIVLATTRILSWFFFMLPLYGISERLGCEWAVLDWAYPCIGILVTFKNRERLEKPNLPKIIVLNHRSDQDFCLFYYYGQRMVYAMTPFMQTICKITEKVGPIIHTINVREEHNQTNPDEETKKRIKNRINEVLNNPDSTLCIAPEGATTNGKGILQFNKHIFSLGYEIQPVAIKTYPLFNVGINNDHIFDDGFSNIFFIGYTPFIRYEYEFLERVKIREGETAEQFADRTQKLLADHLEIPALRWTFKDKVAFRKTKAKNP